METRTGEMRVHVIPPKADKIAQSQTSGRKLRVAAYCRVSTDSEEQLNSYEAQKAYYTQMISEKPEWELAGIFADEGISGTSLKNRTEFNRMIAACKRGRIDMILTKSLSRFARNTVDSLEVVRMLKARNIGVVFEKENINTLRESSEFLITLFSSFAQAESESLSKNVSWGIQKNMEAGKVHINYGMLLGYRKGSDGQPEIDPEQAKVVKRIFHSYLAGYSLVQIKKALEADHVLTSTGKTAWSHDTIKGILTNEKYIGDALLQKTFTTDCISKTVKKNNGERTMYYVENHHPAIISREQFRQVQAEMARRSSRRKVLQKSAKTEQGKYSGKYALTERLVCGECGSPYKRCTWTIRGRKQIVWRCVSRLEFGKKYCHNSPTLDEGKLHQAILDAINEYADAQRAANVALECAVNAIGGSGIDGVRLADLQMRLQQITEEQEILLDQLLADMDNVELTEKMQSLTEEKQRLNQQIEQLEQQTQQKESENNRIREFRAWLQVHPAGLREYDDRLVRQYIEKVVAVDKTQIKMKVYSDDRMYHQTVL